MTMEQGGYKTMTTEKDIKLEYIHYLADVLLDITAGDPRVQALVELIYRESENN